MMTMIMIATKMAALLQNRSFLNERYVLISIIGCFGFKKSKIVHTSVNKIVKQVYEISKDM